MNWVKWSRVQQDEEWKAEKWKLLLTGAQEVLKEANKLRAVDGKPPFSSVNIEERKLLLQSNLNQSIKILFVN